MQLKGMGRFLLQGSRFPCEAIESPYRPSVSLTGALFNCIIVGLIVGHSPGLNGMGPRGASKSIGLGRT